jgi:hypothetical protein
MDIFIIALVFLVIGILGGFLAVLVIEQKFMNLEYFMDYMEQKVKRKFKK